MVFLNIVSTVIRNLVRGRKDGSFVQNVKASGGNFKNTFIVDLATGEHGLLTKNILSKVTGNITETIRRSRRIPNAGLYTGIAALLHPRNLIKTPQKISITIKYYTKTDRRPTFRTVIVNENQYNAHKDNLSDLAADILEDIDSDPADAESVEIESIDIF